MSSAQWFIPTVCLLAMLGGLWFAAVQLRRRGAVGGGTVGPNALPIVGKRTLEQRKSLFIVQVADRYLLLGTAETSVQLIDRITAEEFAAMSAMAEVAPVDMGGLAAKAAGKLRLVRPGTTADAVAADADVAVAEAGDDEAAAEATGTDGQFLSVGESFHYFLDKARNRGGKRAAAGGTQETGE
jgi:flagellar biogenesis protein FliO